MAGLTSMMNIGKEMEKKLASIGIDCFGKLMVKRIKFGGIIYGLR